jgi:hypothetical protein
MDEDAKQEMTAEYLVLTAELVDTTLLLVA